MAIQALALLTAVVAQATLPTPASTPRLALEWLTCSSVRSPQGQITYVDQYLDIYFESGSADIDAQNADRLDLFAAQVMTPFNCQLSVSAHADRVGAARANLALSRRRAEAVRDYLRSRGLAVPMTVDAFGETRPLIETPDGVAEPQNRRADIVVVELPLH